jgi:hypothetical protein
MGYIIGGGVVHPGMHVAILEESANVPCDGIQIPIGIADQPSPAGRLVNRPHTRKSDLGLPTLKGGILEPDSRRAKHHD